MHIFGIHGYECIVSTLLLCRSFTKEGCVSFGGERNPDDAIFIFDSKIGEGGPAKVRKKSSSIPGRPLLFLSLSFSLCGSDVYSLRLPPLFFCLFFWCLFVLVCVLGGRAWLVVCAFVRFSCVIGGRTYVRSHQLLSVAVSDATVRIVDCCSGNPPTQCFKFP